jgi:eukaryotic-like serine/threonine-protein kinase
VSGTWEDSDRAFADALRDEEIRRTRLVIPATLLLALIVAPLLPLLRGHPIAKMMAYVGIAVTSAALLYLRWLAARPERFLERRVGAAYLAITLGVFAIAYYAGVYSTAAAMVPVGIFFTGIGRSRTVAFLIYLLNALCHGLVAMLVIVGTIPDHGLLSSAPLNTAEKIIAPLSIQGIFLITFLMGRFSRRQLDNAVMEHAGAIRVIAKRDALLEEAKRDLQRALQLGVAGRFTNQRFGSYILGVVIGRGAMGDVYEAVHRETGAPAAVKLMTLRGLGDAKHLARFLREARAVATLSSPHVVRLLEVGDPTEELPYLAMERLTGQDLSHHLRDERALSIAAAADLVGQVAAGLAAAREAGVVHRDIKPQNLFLAEAPPGPPTWKILDFGISKLSGSQETLTAGVLIGTPAYMAPEQAHGREVDHRADVYGLATVAFRALTGHPPFAGKDAAGILYAVVHTMPRRPSELAALPAALDDVLMIGMAKAPADRFGSAEELAAAFAEAAEDRLSSELRARARELERKHPWGKHILRSNPPTF